MNNFFSDLTGFQAVFFVISASSTVILVIQTILALIGMTNDTDAEIGESYVSDGEVDLDIADSADGELGVSGGEAEGGGVLGPLHDPTGLRLFTVKGIMSFLMMGGWVGFLFSRAGIGDVVSLICALVSGMITLVLMAKVMQVLMSMQEDGSTRMKNALGQVGQVYIRIPGEEKGKGKVNVTVQEKLCEFDAVTEESETIKTGETVYVTDVRPGNVLVVEKVKGQ